MVYVNKNKNDECGRSNIFIRLVEGEGWKDGDRGY